MKTPRPASGNPLMPPAQILEELVGLGGLSQAEIVRLTGISQPTMSRILNGKVGCALVNYMALVDLHREHFSPASCARRTRQRKALEDSIREQVLADLAAAATPQAAPTDANVAETATE